MLRSVAMLVDFALEFDQFEMYAFGQTGEFSWVGERGFEGTQIGWHRLDELVGSCKLASDMLLVKVERGRGRGSKKQQ